jgi:hypothetical protein
VQKQKIIEGSPMPIYLLLIIKFLRIPKAAIVFRKGNRRGSHSYKEDVKLRKKKTTLGSMNNMIVFFPS